MGYDEKTSFPENNDAKLSQVANMDSFHPGSLNDPPSPREHDHINRPLESYHIMPTKREIIDLVDTESSSSSEEIDVDSAAAAALISP
uniref:Uncharacterized protein n=1 Tax=Kalanchoe fedtschenkoi TaxID=63787 RepID=A0A7N0RBM1_KALFE